MIDRALTAGGNKKHNIERIVAYFQRGELVDLDTEGSADFLAREYGEGDKGVKIDGQDYALWFSKKDEKNVWFVLDIWAPLHRGIYNSGKCPGRNYAESSRRGLSLSCWMFPPMQPMSL